MGFYWHFRWRVYSVVFLLSFRFVVVIVGVGVGVVFSFTDHFKFIFFLSGNLFPEYQGTIITIFSVSLDSSSIVFLILQVPFLSFPFLNPLLILTYPFSPFFLPLPKIIHNAFDLTYHQIFFGYIIFPLLNLILGVWLWPSKSYPVLGNKVKIKPRSTFNNKHLNTEHHQYPS